MVVVISCWYEISKLTLSNFSDVKAENVNQVPSGHKILLILIVILLDIGQKSDLKNYNYINRARAAEVSRNWPKFNEPEVKESEKEGENESKSDLDDGNKLKFDSNFGEEVELEVKNLKNLKNGGNPEPNDATKHKEGVRQEGERNKEAPNSPSLVSSAVDETQADVDTTSTVPVSSAGDESQADVDTGNRFVAGYRHESASPPLLDSDAIHQLTVQSSTANSTEHTFNSKITPFQIYTVKFWNLKSDEKEILKLKFMTKCIYFRQIKDSKDGQLLQHEEGEKRSPNPIRSWGSKVPLQGRRVRSRGKSALTPESGRNGRGRSRSEPRPLGDKLGSQVQKGQKMTVERKRRTESNSAKNPPSSTLPFLPSLPSPSLYSITVQVIYTDGNNNDLKNLKNIPENQNENENSLSSSTSPTTQTTHSHSTLPLPQLTPHHSTLPILTPLQKTQSIKFESESNKEERSHLQEIVNTYNQRECLQVNSIKLTETKLKSSCSQHNNKFFTKICTKICITINQKSAFQSNNTCDTCPKPGVPKNIYSIDKTESIMHLKCKKLKCKTFTLTLNISCRNMLLKAIVLRLRV